MLYTVLEIKFEFTGPNQILEFIFILFLKENEKFTVPNKVLMVLSWRTGAHCEDCVHTMHINFGMF